MVRHGQTWGEAQCTGNIWNILEHIGTYWNILEHEMTVASCDIMWHPVRRAFQTCTPCAGAAMAWAWRNGIEKAEALDMKEQVVTDARRVLKEEKAGEEFCASIHDDKSDSL